MAPKMEWKHAGVTSLHEALRELYDWIYSNKSITYTKNREHSIIWNEQTLILEWTDNACLYLHYYYVNGLTHAQPKSQ